MHSPHSHREAIVGGGKQQKKNDVAEARNCRALGDIGNLVTICGIEGKPNRPITRSLCAQLLANAQAVTAAENNKKQFCVNVEGAPLLLDGVAAGKRVVAPKPQKKVVVKPSWLGGSRSHFGLGWSGRGRDQRAREGREEAVSFWSGVSRRR